MPQAQLHSPALVVELRDTRRHMDVFDQAGSMLHSSVTVTVLELSDLVLQGLDDDQQAVARE